MTQDVFVKFTLNGSKEFEQARINMLKQQIRTWDVLDTSILKLFYSVPRENFVPEKYKSLAFADMNIPLAHGQSMMTPKEEARILQDLHIHSHERILVLGTDSGYLVTLLSKLGQHVYFIDNDLEAMERTKNAIVSNGAIHCTPLIGNLHHGWQDISPFDVIILTGSLPSIPDFLKNALTIKGRLFVVVGKAPVMEAMIITRLSENVWSEIKIFETLRPRMREVKEPDSFVF